MKEKLIFVTGANDGYFWQIMLLLETFYNYHQQPLYVCDFGFAEEQANFLRELGVLLEIPQPLPRDLHPWYYKAALGLFVAEVPGDHIIWVDADMLPTRSIIKPVLHTIKPLLAEKYLAACCNYCPKSIINEINLLEGQFDVTPFRQLVKSEPGLGKQYYLNSGFFMTNDRDFLLAWHDLSVSIESHVLFEQNAFNYCAYTSGLKFKLLNDRTWNLHAERLEELITANIKAGQLTFAIDNTPVLLIHLTNISDHYMIKYVRNIRINGYSVEVSLRYLDQEYLRNYEEQVLMHSVSRFSNQLIEYGVLTKDG